jgi:hypothetical protein
MKSKKGGKGKKGGGGKKKGKGGKKQPQQQPPKVDQKPGLVLPDSETNVIKVDQTPRFVLPEDGMLSLGLAVWLISRGPMRVLKVIII